MVTTPYGRELTGYEVADIQGTLSKAKAAGVVVLVPIYQSDGRSAAMLQFSRRLRRPDTHVEVMRALC
jgi:hypothetical protein